MWESSKGLVQGNNISNVQDGIAAISLHGDTHSAIGNTILNCYLGIRMAEGHTAAGNTISDCSVGLEIGWNSHVEGNQVSGCALGIDLSGESHTLVKNTISNCDLGLKAVPGQDNYIYHNNFIDNTIQAEDYGNNNWDNGTEGNYWSDYTGEDADSNGIGDTPYLINPSGVDQYPLIREYTSIDEIIVNVTKSFELSQNYPNPFNSATTIPFTVPSPPVNGSQFMVNSPSPVTLKIYNILGQRVRTLVDEKKLPGEYRVNWDGKDEKGNEVGSGIYLYKLKAGDYQQVKKMVLIK
jgi:parallel beta-helix repeat protein